MSRPPTAARPWEDIQAQIAATIVSGMDRSKCMHAFIDACWPLLQHSGVSWMGFYQRTPADPMHLSLAARQPVPACSPIGLHGACGQCLLARRPLVIAHVASLGSNYIACDPRDQSEIVLPCLEPDGTAWGVLDLDSHEIASFDLADAASLENLLVLAGLSAKLSNDAVQL